MNALFLAASGATSQLAGLATAADNLANLNTPGFRRFQNAIEAVNGNDTPYQYAASTPATISLAQGPMQSTSNPLDVALSGPGFMRVQTPTGTAYTRDGTLQIRADGALTAAGYPLLNPTGAAINVGQGGNLVIGGDGSLSVNGIASGQIAMGDPSGIEMMPAGSSLYRTATGESLPPASTASQMHQGFIEGSSGSEMGTMVAMLNMMRNYDASMKAVHAIDTNQNQAVQTFTLTA
jgi:flagellar basal-body rod protein FlgF